MSIYNQLSVVYFIFFLFLIYKIFKKEKADVAPLLSCCLTKYERPIEVDIRKKWLISFVLMSLISTLSFFCRTIDAEGVESVSIEIGIPLALVISTIPVVPWFWITYHCSFKKKGTRWLSWTMVTIPLRELSDVPNWKWSEFKDWDVLNWFFFTLALGVEAYYLFTCFRLYKINSKRKKVEFDILLKNSNELSSCILKKENL